MKVGECKWITCPWWKLVVERAIEDEYDILFFSSDQYDHRKVQLHMITVPSDNKEVMLMELIWLHCAVQLGYHQVVNLFEE